MKTDWKIWNYKGKNVALARFVLFGFMTGLTFCQFWIFRDVEFIVLAVISAVAACFCGYRTFFFSDDWVHAKEVRSADWWDKHPHLRNVYSTTGWIIYLLIIACLLWMTYRK